MRVLFVAPGSRESATVRYRCVHLAEALSLRGVEADVVSAQDTRVRIAHDVVVLHRLGWYGGTGKRFADAARASGAVVVYSTDDLIFEPEYGYQVGLLHPDDPVRYFYHAGASRDDAETLQNADAVLTSTQFLAKRITRFVGTKPVFVVRNFLSSEMLRLSQEAISRRDSAPFQTGGRVTLGYLSGSPTHDGDFAEIAAPLARAFTQFPGARLLVVGPVAIPSALLPLADAGRILRHPFVPWRDLPGLLATIDLNLAPLDASRAFNHAKSEIKFLEAGAVGVPTLAGRAEGFSEGIRCANKTERLCLIVENQADWERLLLKTLGQLTGGEPVAPRVREFIQTCGSVDAHADTVVETFTQIAALRSAAARQPSETIVQRPLRERIAQAGRAHEAAFFRRWFRFKRHLRLIAEEQRGGPL